jgi:glycosyltransferase involved in cell wall biosynthesis
MHQPAQTFSLGSSLSAHSKVLALVPYFNCETWLEQCLDSLTSQTRIPQGILVLDDASVISPQAIVEKFPQVTLWRSPENVGPYALLRSAIDQTQFDAYLFQDADDWSAYDRLEKLIEGAQQTGAEWIGTQELMILGDNVRPIRYPLTFNQLRDGSLSHPICYPSSLISKNFLTQLGGFASGLRISGDLELISRAVWTAQAANLDDYGYFRRIRNQSLITSPETGLGSPLRVEIGNQIKARKIENHSRVQKGLLPLLEPLVVGKPISFQFVTGPQLS